MTQYINGQKLKDFVEKKMVKRWQCKKSFYGKIIIIRSDRNRKCGAVVSSVSNNICYNSINCISNEREDICYLTSNPENKTNYCWNHIKKTLKSNYGL